MISFVGFTRWHLNKQLIKFFIGVLTGVFLALSLKKVLCVVFHSLLSKIQKSEMTKVTFLSLLLPLN